MREIRHIVSERVMISDCALRHVTLFTNIEKETGYVENFEPIQYRSYDKTVININASAVKMQASLITEYLTDVLTIIINHYFALKNWLIISPTLLYEEHW